MNRTRILALAAAGTAALLILLAGLGIVDGGHTITNPAAGDGRRDDVMSRGLKWAQGST